MNVLIVEPGYLPYKKEVNGLHEMQAVVGGLICEIQPFHDGVALVSNDDAIGMGMEFNRSLPNGFGGIFGTFFPLRDGWRALLLSVPGQYGEVQEVFSQRRASDRSERKRGLFTSCCCQTEAHSEAAQ